MLNISSDFRKFESKYSRQYAYKEVFAVVTTMGKNLCPTVEEIENYQ